MTKPTITLTKPTNQSKKQAAEEKKIASSQETQINWQDKYLRLRADFDNREKRIKKQQIAWISMANKTLITALLPVLEDLERAIRADKKSKDQHPVKKEGIAIIHEKLFKILQQQGLTPIEVQPGHHFDPDYHQALTTTPIKDEKLKDKVVEVVTKGYLLGKQVIQAAKVIIGK